LEEKEKKENLEAFVGGSGGGIVPNDDQVRRRFPAN